jgi:hypothetical protein
LLPFLTRSTATPARAFSFHRLRRNHFAPAKSTLAGASSYHMRAANRSACHPTQASAGRGCVAVRACRGATQGSATPIVQALST